MENKLVKVFISQPMANRTKEEIFEERNKIAERLREFHDNIEIIDTWIEDGSTPVECLGKSIMMLKDADLVVFADNYRLARGCRVENLVCIEYNIKCISNIYNEYYLKSVFSEFK